MKETLKMLAGLLYCFLPIIIFLAYAVYCKNSKKSCLRPQDWKNIPEDDKSKSQSGFEYIV